MSKKTPWFNGGKNPTRVGWYEVKGDSFVEGHVVMRRWNGKGWEWKHQETNTMCSAAVSIYDKWRGLLKENKPA